MRALASGLAALVLALPLAAQQIEELIAGLGDEKLRDRCSGELVLRGTAAAEPLVAALDAAVKAGAVARAEAILRVIERLGLDASGAESALFAAAEKLPTEQAALALTAVGAVVPPGVAGDVTQHLRRSLLDVLNSGHPNPRQLADSLLPSFDAARLRSRMTRTDDIELMVEGLSDPKSDFSALCYDLGRAGKRAAAAIDPLAARLDRTHHYLRKRTDRKPIYKILFDTRAAALAIIEIAPQSSQAASANAYLLQREPFLSLRTRAARRLLTAGPLAEPALPQLIAYLESTRAEEEILEIVLNCLVVLGPAAVDATPELRRLRKHDSERIRKRAAAVLRQIDKDG